MDDAQAYAVQRRIYAGLQSGLTLRDAFWTAQRSDDDPTRASACSSADPASMDHRAAQRSLATLRFREG